MQITRELGKPIRHFAATFLLILGGGLAAFASDSSHEEKEFSAKETIMHHITDAHDWHILDWNGHPVSLALPVILYTENGIVTFMSSEFHHDDAGTVVVEKNGMQFVKAHGSIYYASAHKHEGAWINHTEDGEILNEAPLDFSITKNAASVMFVGLICILLFLVASRRYSKNGVPKGIASFVEPLVVFVRDDIAKANIGEKHYKRFVPYLLTLFFFIWINNMLGLVPLIPGGANTTGNIAVTFVLALLTFLIVNFNGNKHYWQHMFWMPGVPVPVRIMLAPIELVGAVAKAFALMVRLFANMTAGHIVILGLISLIFVFQNSAVAIASVPMTLFIYLIKVLVALLQAYIFVLLSALFIGQAVEEPHH